MDSGEELAAFVAARLDEEEAAARETAPYWPPGALCVLDHPEQSAWFALTVTQAEHIARYDPARGLREVAAKRQRLALYLEARDALAAVLRDAPALDDPALAHSYVRQRINVNQASGRFAAFEMSVRLDAMTWRDHPDYRQDWTPATG